MAVEITFTNNFDEVIDLLTTATSKALFDIGTIVQEDAVKNSPKRTGALQQSWTVKINDNEKSVIIGVPYDALEGNYAKYVELGTSRGQIPHHMLRNAVQQNIDQFRNITIAGFKNA